MAIGWMNALKVIPWGNVIEAAPGVVKSARKMFARAQEAEEAAHAPVATGDASAHIARLETSLAQLAEQQKASARLIETLAEQNARVVEAVDTLRVRTRVLMIACLLLAAGLAGVVAWGLR